MKNLSVYQKSIRWFLFEKQPWHNIAVRLLLPITAVCLTIIYENDFFNGHINKACFIAAILLVIFFIFFTSINTLAEMWQHSGAAFYSKPIVNKSHYRKEEIERLNHLLQPFSFKVKNSLELYKSMRHFLRNGPIGPSPIGIQEMSEIYETVFATSFEDLPTMESFTERGNLAVMWRYEIGK